MKVKPIREIGETVRDGDKVAVNKLPYVGNFIFVARGREYTLEPRP